MSIKSKLKNLENKLDKNNRKKPKRVVIVGYDYVKTDAEILDKNIIWLVSDSLTTAKFRSLAQ